MKLGEAGERGGLERAGAVLAGVARDGEHEPVGGAGAEHDPALERGADPALAVRERVADLDAQIEAV